MEKLPLWVMTADEELKARWRRWLDAQGWTLSELPAGSVPARLPGGSAGPLLVDAAQLKESDLPALRSLAEGKYPLIVFGEGRNGTDEAAIKWLKQGADDFFPAGIHERLLLAKLESHMRRLVPELDQNVLFSPRRKVKADVRRRLAWTKNGGSKWDPVPSLTETEHKLLCLFLAAPETPLDRNTILDKLWGQRADEVYTSTLTQHVMSLRKKLGERGDAIKTVYGTGYLFQEAT